MEGQAVSDWEKAPGVDWCKFWFSRSSCKDDTSQEQGSRVGGPGASLPSLVHLESAEVLSWGWESCQHQWAEMPVPWISVSAAAQRAQTHLPSSQVQQMWHPGAVGTAASYPCSLTARRAENILWNAWIYIVDRRTWSPEKSCPPRALCL